MLHHDPLPPKTKHRKVDYHKGKEHANRANARATIDFATRTIQKVEQIEQQNAFNLFTLEDLYITCKIAFKWLTLCISHELAKF